MNPETRLFSKEVWHLRSGDPNSSDLQVAGYAARYGKYSTDPGLPFKEIIQRGAFKNVLAAKPNVVCLLNHDANQLLGRTTAGTLTLMEDPKGLKFVCSLPDTELGRSVRESVKRGDLDGCSFSFECAPEDCDWTHRSADDINTDINAEDDDDLDDDLYRAMRGKAIMPNDTPVRIIKNFHAIHDVSVVTYPAYASTSVVTRSVKNIIDSAPVEYRSRMLERLTQDFNERVLGRSRRRRLLDIA